MAGWWSVELGAKRTGSAIEPGSAAVIEDQLDQSVASCETRVMRREAEAEAEAETTERETNVGGEGVGDWRSNDLTAAVQ